MDLTRLPLLKAALKNRCLQSAIMALMLAGYLFAILAGLIGSPVGSRNFSIVFVWIAWWAGLILVIVPFFGRGWCAVCPIPLPGEWLQRGAVLTPPKRRPRWLGLRWPRFLRNIWLQNIAFLLLALFSSVLLTTPRVTAIVLAALLFIALGLSLLFERRAFCRYLCPVGGFIGLYAQAAPLELRVKEKSLCAACPDKPCYNGSPTGYGCPWNVFPGGLTKNTYCGLCLECLRTCPYENIALNLRPFGADLARPSARKDEAFKAFIMLGSALIYAAVLLGPWGALKDAAYRVGTPAWALYILVFLAIVLVLLPASFALVTSPPLVRKARGDGLPSPFGKGVGSESAALIPLGLMFWVAFSLSFVLTNASYILSTLSDPLGLGWNLFGTAGVAWQPVLTALLAPSQILVLIGGLAWSAHIAQRIAAAGRVSPKPVILYSFSLTALMLWLLL